METRREEYTQPIFFVIPAKAGIQPFCSCEWSNAKSWIPAFAGMTS
jgi:hypothetical protein